MDPSPWQSRAIDIEAVTTWPEPVREILFDSLPDLRNYESKREQIDVAARHDYRLRVRRPPNPFGETRRIVLGRINVAIQNLALLGFHCTRLHRDEISEIRRSGLDPLSAGKLRCRIETRMKAGDIPAELGKRLLVEHQANESNRSGMIWFVNSRSSLTYYSGLFRLFRNWGGEALYNSHERDPDTGPLLRSIGLPAIVVAALPIRNFRISSDIGDKIIWSFLAKNGIQTDHSADLEGYMEEPVRTRMMEIITLEHCRFRDLTQCHLWPESIE